ncbi:MAG: hypothetical protein ACERLM_16705 [Acidimicrobiales bacterium]
MVTNGGHPNGVEISTDDVIDGGLNLNAFVPHGYACVTVELGVAATDAGEGQGSIREMRGTGICLIT